jgi:hypothetical protein
MQGNLRIGDESMDRRIGSDKITSIAYPFIPKKSSSAIKQFLGHSKGYHTIIIQNRNTVQVQYFSFVVDRKLYFYRPVEK